MSWDCQNFHRFIPQSYSLLLIACLAKVVLLQELGRDTLKTITADESYELGYFISKYQTHESCFFSTTSLGLIHLASEEFKIYNAAVEAYSKVKASRGSRSKKLIHEYLEDYNDTSGFLMMTLRRDGILASEVAGEDLLGAYRMVRRFRNYIQNGLRGVLASPETSSSLSLNTSKDINALKPLCRDGPFKQDLHLTMFAIIFAQLLYGWNSRSVSTGTIKGMELGTALRAVHCIELGVHAVASGIYSVGIDWLELAAIKLKNGDPSADLKLTLDLLQKTKAEHDRLWGPLTFRSLNATFFTKRLNETAGNDRRQWQRSIVFDNPLDYPEDGTSEGPAWDICAGRLVQTEDTKTELFCWRETMVHPFWKIGPLKVELLAKFPFQVIQFHDVLESSKFEQIHAVCDTKLEPSILLSDRDFLDPKLRLSEGCSGALRHLDYLTERITGLLSADFTKKRPVVYYPPGGHIRLHVDKAGSKGFVQRIATVIYFLEGPEVGGELVFPNVRVAAKPLKGSAILWYNVLKSSEFDYGTTHASCPVVRGRKTIATDWISYRLQTHLTCDRDSEAKMKYLFNGKTIL